jgi:hypothetical protein
MEPTKMTRRPASFTNVLLIAAWLAVGCTSSGTLGCGSGDGASASTVDTQLLGIYQLDQYQQSQGGCDQLIDVDPAPSRLAIYTVPSNDNPDKGVLVGRFCGSVLDCRSRVKEDPPSIINYSFLEGSDATGWTGWGFPGEGGMVGDQCRVEVQTHTLTSSSPQAIRIDTRQVETVFMGMVEGNEATCTFRDAIASVSDESPCTALFLLEATFETSL